MPFPPVATVTLHETDLLLIPPVNQPPSSDLQDTKRMQGDAGLIRALGPFLPTGVSGTERQIVERAVGKDWRMYFLAYNAVYGRTAGHLLLFDTLGIVTRLFSPSKLHFAHTAIQSTATVLRFSCQCTQFTLTEPLLEVDPVYFTPLPVSFEVSIIAGSASGQIDRITCSITLSQADAVKFGINQHVVPDSPVFRHLQRLKLYQVAIPADALMATTVFPTRGKGVTDSKTFCQQWRDDYRDTGVRKASATPAEAKTSEAKEETASPVATVPSFLGTWTEAYFKQKKPKAAPPHLLKTLVNWWPEQLATSGNTLLFSHMMAFSKVFTHQVQGRTVHTQNILSVFYLSYQPTGETAAEQALAWPMEVQFDMTDLANAKLLNITVSEIDARNFQVGRQLRETYAQRLLWPLLEGMEWALMERWELYTRTSRLTNILIKRAELGIDEKPLLLLEDVLTLTEDNVPRLIVTSATLVEEVEQARADFKKITGWLEPKPEQKPLPFGMKVLLYGLYKVSRADILSDGLKVKPPSGGRDEKSSLPASPPTLLHSPRSGTALPASPSSTSSQTGSLLLSSTSSSASVLTSPSFPGSPTLLSPFSPPGTPPKQDKQPAEASPSLTSSSSFLRSPLPSSLSGRLLSSLSFSRSPLFAPLPATPSFTVTPERKYTFRELTLEHKKVLLEAMMEALSPYLLQNIRVAVLAGSHSVQELHKSASIMRKEVDPATRVKIPITGLEQPIASELAEAKTTTPLKDMVANFWRDILELADQPIPSDIIRWLRKSQTWSWFYQWILVMEKQGWQFARAGHIVEIYGDFLQQLGQQKGYFPRDIVKLVEVRSGKDCYEIDYLIRFSQYTTSATSGGATPLKTKSPMELCVEIRLTPLPTESRPLKPEDFLTVRTHLRISRQDAKDFGIPLSYPLVLAPAAIAVPSALQAQKFISGPFLDACNAPQPEDVKASFGTMHADVYIEQFCRDIGMETGKTGSSEDRPESSKQYPWLRLTVDNMFKARPPLSIKSDFVSMKLPGFLLQHIATRFDNPDIGLGLFLGDKQITYKVLGPSPHAIEVTYHFKQYTVLAPNQKGEYEAKQHPFAAPVSITGVVTLTASPRPNRRLTQQDFFNLRITGVSISKQDAAVLQLQPFFPRWFAINEYVREECNRLQHIFETDRARLLKLQQQEKTQAFGQSEQSVIHYYLGDTVYLKQLDVLVSAVQRSSLVYAEKDKLLAQLHQCYQKNQQLCAALTAAHRTTVDELSSPGQAALEPIFWQNMYWSVSSPYRQNQAVQAMKAIQFEKPDEKLTLLERLDRIKELSSDKEFTFTPEFEAFVAELGSVAKSLTMAEQLVLYSVFSLSLTQAFEQRHAASIEESGGKKGVVFPLSFRGSVRDSKGLSGIVQDKTTLQDLRPVLIAAIGRAVGARVSLPAVESLQELARHEIRRGLRISAHRDPLPTPAPLLPALSAPETDRASSGASSVSVPTSASALPESVGVPMSGGLLVDAWNKSMVLHQHSRSKSKEIKAAPEKLVNEYIGQFWRTAGQDTLDKAVRFSDQHYPWFRKTVTLMFAVCPPTSIDMVFLYNAAVRFFQSHANALYESGQPLLTLADLSVSTRHIQPYTIEVMFSYQSYRTNIEEQQGRLTAPFKITMQVDANPEPVVEARPLSQQDFFNLRVSAIQIAKPDAEVLALQGYFPHWFPQYPQSEFDRLQRVFREQSIRLVDLQKKVEKNRLNAQDNQWIDHCLDEPRHLKTFILTVNSSHLVADEKARLLWQIHLAYRKNYQLCMSIRARCLKVKPSIEQIFWQKINWYLCTSYLQDFAIHKAVEMESDTGLGLEIKKERKDVTAGSFKKMSGLSLACCAFIAQLGDEADLFTLSDKCLLYSVFTLSVEKANEEYRKNASSSGRTQEVAAGITESLREDLIKTIREAVAGCSSSVTIAECLQDLAKRKSFPDAPVASVADRPVVASSLSVTTSGSSSSGSTLSPSGIAYPHTPLTSPGSSASMRDITTAFLTHPGVSLSASSVTSSSSSSSSSSGSGSNKSYSGVSALEYRSWGSVSFLSSPYQSSLAPRPSSDRLGQRYIHRSDLPEHEFEESKPGTPPPPPPDEDMESDSSSDESDEETMGGGNAKM